tara:strand:- start:177 stop:329 length:153 start_codon:yes stop_codon:yes gene_type:complete
MQTIALIIVLQVVVTLLTGCTEFETKMDMMKSEQLTCSAEDMTLCAGWKV